MPSHQTLLCRYHYDPLDRLAGHAAIGEVDIRLFYRKSRLATQIQGALRRSVLQVDDQLLAQQSSGKAVATTLLATDQQRSVLHSIDDGEHEALVYNAYGHLSAGNGLSCLFGFDGERRDPLTGHYLLGNGYRAFNPVLMRFNSPDSLSSFGEGGLNAYAYCQGDPANYRDPTGHIKVKKIIGNFAGLSASPPRGPSPVVAVSQSPAIQSSSTAVARVSSDLSSSVTPSLASGRSVTPGAQTSGNAEGFSWTVAPASDLSAVSQRAGGSKKKILNMQVGSAPRLEFESFLDSLEGRRIGLYRPKDFSRMSQQDFLTHKNSLRHELFLLRKDKTAREFALGVEERIQQYKIASVYSAHNGWLKGQTRHVSSSRARKRIHEIKTELAAIRRS